MRSWLALEVGLETDNRHRPDFFGTLQGLLSRFRVAGLLLSLEVLLVLFFFRNVLVDFLEVSGVVRE